MNEVMAIAKRAAESYVLGDPNDPKTTLGPLISKAHWEKVQGLIKMGIEDGATLVTGGLGLPDGITRGYFAKPTVFGNVTRDMRIAKNEIFGMTLMIMGYGSIDEAVEIANDTEYGLAGYVQSADIEKARAVARRGPDDAIRWTVVFDSGLDPSDPALRRLADDALAHLRAVMGV